MHRLLVVCVACAVLTSTCIAEEYNPEKIAEIAGLIAQNADKNMVGGIANVAQAAGSAQVAVSLILIKQNNEIIRLLQKIAKEK